MMARRMGQNKSLQSEFHINKVGTYYRHGDIATHMLQLATPNGGD